MLKLSASVIALSGAITNQVTASNQEDFMEKERAQPLTPRGSATNLPSLEIRPDAGHSNRSVNEVLHDEMQSNVLPLTQSLFKENMTENEREAIRLVVSNIPAEERESVITSAMTLIADTRNTMSRDNRVRIIEAASEALSANPLSSNLSVQQMLRSPESA